MIERAIAFTTLLMASAYDLKSREVPDWVWVPGIALGLVMRSLYIELTLSYLAISWPFLLALSLFLVIEWYFSTSGQADVLAYLTLSVIATEPATPIPAPFLTYLLSKILLLSVLPFQFVFNLIRISRDPDLLKGFEEPTWRIVLALLLLSPYSRHLSVGARVAEISDNGRRKFLLGASLSPIGEGEVDEEVLRGKWITPTYPLIPFILAAYMITQIWMLPLLP